MAQRLTVQEAFQRWRTKIILGDRIAMSVFFFGGIFLLWYEVHHVSSLYYKEWTTTYVLQVLLGLFFAVNIYGNWLLLFLTDVTGKDVVLPSGQAPPGWKYCPACTANEPARSHHCPICNACVLKRDHHCWFAGTCIGHANHRYFLALCIHIVLAGLYCNFYNWTFVWSVKGEITLLKLVSFVLPHLTAVMGEETWYSFYLSTVSMVGFFLTCLFLWLLQIQVVQLIHGQTKHERKNGIDDYDLGFRGNLQAILGHRMYLTLLCPFIKSSLSSDGTKFHSHSAKAM